MTAPAGGEKPQKKPPRIVMTMRVSETGKARFVQAASQQGYDQYTAWARDVLAAEALNPKHRPKPPPKEK